MAKSSQKNHDVIIDSTEANAIIDTFFKEENNTKIIDVRTPMEYEKGHVLGAINIPLLSNEERVEIGTLYKQSSPEIAFDKGIKLVGPKMHSFLKAARRYMGTDPAVIYCWRGGKRSQSMSWLFNMAGLHTKTVPGGYKSYRRYATEVLGQKDIKLIVIGGKTGSGKTKILHELKAQGEQIIDLEGLANHKGSAFGWIGEEAQPSIEHFENKLAFLLKNLDLSRPIWIENESRRIGRVALQEDFWANLKSSPLVNIVIPTEARVKHLVEIYDCDDAADLNEAFTRIKKRLGGLNLKNALKAIEKNDLEEAARIALTYYDKSYSDLLNDNLTEHIFTINFDHGNFPKIASHLIEFKKEMNNK